MNKKLKLLQRSKVLKTLEVEKVKHDLSKIDNSTIAMVAYDDTSDKFLIGDNSGDLYVATPEYLKSLNINKDTDISSVLVQMTKSSIAEHFTKISVQEVREMFKDRYIYYWSANGKFYGVKQGLIERIDEGPDATKPVELWDRSENIFSNDRGVNELKEIKFSAELRPAFLTFSNEALPVYKRSNNLTIHDPVKVSDIMNKDLQTQDYVPSGSHYGYDMKDSNAVMKAYLGTDDLIIISNNDRRNVVDIDPPVQDPDNEAVTYDNNTPFNHNYSMLWSEIRSGRVFEEFNDEMEDDKEAFVGMTRHEQTEINVNSNTRASSASVLSLSEDSDVGGNHISVAGAYANVPNLDETYTTYIETEKSGEKQIYDNSKVANSIKNVTMWSLDEINDKQCKVSRRVYNTITGEVKNAERHYDAVIGFEVVDIKNDVATIKRTISVPVLKGAICDFEKFEYKHDASGNAISLPVPEEYVSGTVEYSIDDSIYPQGTNGENVYCMRKVFVQSGATKVFLKNDTITGKAKFSVFNLGANATTATIKRTTSVKFINTDGTEYTFNTTNNNIGTGSVSHSYESDVTGTSENKHVTTHTRTVNYMSGQTQVTVSTDNDYPVVSYEIFNLAAGSSVATLKGSSTGSFATISNGEVQNTRYNIVANRHITVTSEEIRYVRNPEIYESLSNVTCSQTLFADYTFNGVKISKSITKSSNIIHTIYNLDANASSAIIKRHFVPVFYAVSNGIETSASIYKNSEVEINRNSVGVVTYSVSDVVNSVGNNAHYAQHKRSVTFTQNNITVNVNETVYSAPITYKLFNLSAGSTYGTFKGSSVGKFNTIINGAQSATTYDVSRPDHITVNTTSITYSNSAVLYTSTGGSCTRTMHLNYVVSGVTKSIDLTAAATVSHNLYNVTDTSASIIRKFTPVFYTYASGAKTSAVYKNTLETIDSGVTSGVTTTHSVGSSVAKATSGTHYATHTRTIKYTNGSYSTTIDTESVDGAISYIWYNLPAMSGSTVAKTGTWKGTSAGSYSIWKDGIKTSSKYNVSKANHMEVTVNLTTSNNILTYTSEAKQAQLYVTGTYTTGGVTITKTRNSAPANITHYVKTIEANATTATIGRKYVPSIKAIVNGAESSSYFVNNITYNLDDRPSNTITYSTITAPSTGVGSASIRTITYTRDNVTVTVATHNSSNSNKYTVVNHKGTSCTFTNTITATFYCFANGAQNTSVATQKTFTSAVTTGTVSHDSFIWNGSSGTAAIRATYNGVLIALDGTAVTFSSGFSSIDYNAKTIRAVQKLSISKQLTTSSASGNTPYTYTYSENSTNAVAWTHLCKMSDITSSGNIDVTPVMEASASFTFNQINNGSGKTYTKSLRVYSGNPYRVTVKPSIATYSVDTNGVSSINYLYYGISAIRSGDSTSSSISYAGTALSGSVKSVTPYTSSKLAPYCTTHSGFLWIPVHDSCYPRIECSIRFEGTWNGISWSGGCSSVLQSGTNTHGSNAIHYSGSKYKWTNVYTTTPYVTVSCGGVSSKPFRYRSAATTSSSEDAPTAMRLDSFATASGTVIEFQ